MKKVINGKMYDTETAKCVGYYANTEYLTDLDYKSQELFQKKTGEFFLFISGNNVSETIMPKTYADAQEWAEEHLDGNEYEAIFGEIAEDETRRSLNLNISSATVEKLKRLSAQNGKSVSEIIEEFVSTL